MKTIIFLGIFMTALSVVAIPTPDTQITRDAGPTGPLHSVKERAENKEGVSSPSSVAAMLPFVDHLFE